MILTLIVYRVFHYINYHFMKNPSMKESESIWVLKIKRFFKKIRIKRTTVLVLVFVFMSATLVRQLFELQIIQGELISANLNQEQQKTCDQKYAWQYL